MTLGTNRKPSQHPFTTVVVQSRQPHTIYLVDLCLVYKLYKEWTGRLPDMMKPCTKTREASEATWSVSSTCSNEGYVLVRHWTSGVLTQSASPVILPYFDGRLTVFVVRARAPLVQF